MYIAIISEVDALKLKLSNVAYIGNGRSILASTTIHPTIARLKFNPTHEFNSATELDDWLQQDAVYNIMPDFLTQRARKLIKQVQEQEACTQA